MNAQGRQVFRVDGDGMEKGGPASSNSMWFRSWEGLMRESLALTADWNQGICWTEQVFCDLWWVQWLKGNHWLQGPWSEDTWEHGGRIQPLCHSLKTGWGCVALGFLSFLAHVMNLRDLICSRLMSNFWVRWDTKFVLFYLYTVSLSRIPLTFLWCALLTG